MKNLYWLLGTSFVLLSCANGLDGVSPGRVETARKCVHYIQVGNDSALFAMINKESTNIDEEIIAFYTRRTRDLFKEYGVPPERAWYVEYDTTHPVVKLDKIVIPIYKGGSTEHSRLKEASLKLYFDVSGHYLPDTVLARFELYTDYKSTGK